MHTIDYMAALRAFFLEDFFLEDFLAFFAAFFFFAMFSLSKGGNVETLTPRLAFAHDRESGR